MSDRIPVDIAKEILSSFFEGDWYYTNEDIGSNGIIINGEVIHLFLAGQTKSYAIESERGHLFSPIVHYPKMYEVRPKDIIFSCQGAMIKSVNVALESAEGTYGIKNGLRIDCVYNELDNPLDIVYLRPILAGYEPFGSTGKLPQRGYIHRLNSYAGKIMRDEIVKLGNKAK